MTRRGFSSDVLVVGLLLGAAQCRPAPENGGDVAPSAQDVSRQAPGGLAGTTWRLVRFEGGDETVLTPDDRTKYTIAFGADDKLSARIDCNRGMGTWKSLEPSHLEFGPLALTRAMCPPGSLHDRIVKHWPYFRSYVMRDGHLFLALMADGGIYEFEPAGEDERVEGTVRGTATYRERMALPPGAVLEATLEDVSKADAAAEVIGRARVENPGNPPIPFEIRYDSSRVDPSRRYAVRARIVVEGKPFFTTDQHYPVLTGGKGSEVELLLHRAAVSPGATESLENTYWKLVELGGAPVTVVPQAEPHLILNSLIGQVGGAGGCNRLSGGYELDGDRLRLDRLVTTMMACEEGMETEQMFLNELGRVSGWRIAGQQLELLDDGGEVVARFEARHME